MRKFLRGLLFTICGFIALSSTAQVVIDNTLTPQQLVQDVLVGQGVQVSNITFSGDPVQIGFFDASNANFLLDSGIVMSSGLVTEVPGAGNVFASTDADGVSMWPSDSDLDAISNAGTRDAVVLEFDFVPTGDSVKFTYVFGSEEYPEWVNSGFNDVFAFIISGPGFAGPFSNGGENIALLPDGVTPVTIDNVNGNTNSQYYVDNSSGGTNGVVFDGYTVSLVALAEVQCGQTYHLKLAIADAGDDSYDSGVFLKANSFSSNSFTFDIQTPSADSSIVEGCTEAVVNIYSPPSDSVLAYDIIVSGNAVEGVDFTGVPDSLIIQPGDSTFSFVVEPLEDGLSENQVDTIYLTIYTINSCGDSVANQGVVYILESYEIETVITESPGPCVNYNYSVLSPTITGGNPPFEYYWSTGANTSSIQVGFPQQTEVSLYVIDFCGNMSDTAYYLVDPGTAPPQPELTVSDDMLLDCPGDVAAITAEATNGTGPYGYSWSPYGQGTSFTDETMETTYFIVTVTDNCLLQVQDTVLVTVEPYVQPSLTVTDTIVTCPGDTVVLNSFISDGNDPFVYSWSDGTDQDSTIAYPLETTELILTITDDCNVMASDVATVEVPVYPPLEVSVLATDLLISDTVTICELWTDTLWSSVTGGLEPYLYTWSGTLIDAVYSNSDSVIMNVPYELPSDSIIHELYKLMVADACGVVDSVVVPVSVISCDVYAPGSFNPESNFSGNTDFCGNKLQNNSFNLPCLNLYPGNVMTIWDRWGRKCYSTEDYHLNAWDGGNHPAGTYFYVCELPNGKEPVKGYFQLIR